MPPPPRMKTVLFIGHHKVGSSTLQRFLARNAVALLRAGILYPSVESQSLCQNLRTALEGVGPEGAGPDATAPLNVLEPHNALAFRMLADAGAGAVPPYHANLPHSWQMWRMIDSQIAAFSPRAMILCAEVFANFATAPAHLLQDLAAALRGHEVHILCTLRRVDDYLVAWHGQRLKFGHRLAPLRTGAQRSYYEGIHFDYARLLAPWIAAFPEARISLRSYRAVQAAGGAVADFMARADLGFPADLQPVADANPSLPRAAFEIMRRANHALPPAVARDLRDFLLWRPGTALWPESHTVEMFGTDNRRALLAGFAPVGRALATMHPEGAALAEALAPSLAPLPLPEIEAAQSALARLRRLLPLQPLGAEARAFLAALELE